MCLLSYNQSIVYINEQALLKLGECRDDRLRRVTLQVNQDDVVFALQVWTSSYNTSHVTTPQHLLQVDHGSLPELTD